MSKFASSLSLSLLGKSTVINYITNYFRHGTLDRMKIAIPTEFYPVTEKEFKSNENNICDKTQSKTIACNEYTYEDIQNRDSGTTQFCFIDTPGLGDTRGIQFDKQNIKRIFDLVQHMETLTGIILVINGTQPRLTFNIEYVLQQFRHWLPNIVLENVVVILTNCSYCTFNFEPETIGLPSTVKTFYMQNSAFSNNTKKLNEFKQLLENDWAQSMDTLNKIIYLLKNLPPLSTQTFIDMDSDKNELRNLLHESRLIIKELQTLDDALETATVSDKLQKAYTWISVNYHNTLCSKCHYVCHEKCSLNEINKQDESGLSACLAFGDGGTRCTKCPGKCGVKYHYHIRKLINPIDRSQMETLKAVEEEQALKAKSAIEKKLQNQLAEVECYAKHLVKACAEFNLADEFHVFVDYLKSDIKQLKSEGAILQANAFLKKAIVICHALANHTPCQSNMRMKAEVEDIPATSSTCDQMESKTNPTTVVTGNSRNETTEETSDWSSQKTECYTSTDLKEGRIEKVTTDKNGNEMDIGEKYYDPEDSINDDADDATSSRTKEYEEVIDDHMRITQDEERYLLDLYHSMTKEQKIVLLRGVNKLMGIH